MLRFFEILARYIAAIFIAFVVSMSAFLFIVVPLSVSLESWGLPDSLQEGAFYISVAVIGFSGVFTGSLCLEQNSRRAGSIALLIMGLIFYVWLQIYAESLAMNGAVHQRIWSAMLVCLALGGSGAAVLAFRRRPSNPELEPSKEGEDVQ